MNHAAIEPSACHPTPAEFVAAWSFLCGQALCFERQDPAMAEMLADSLAVCLPLRRATNDSTLVVALLMRSDEVMDLASNMFTLPENLISQADLHDAGLEACNVMAGCVAAAFAACEPVQIGLPRSLAPQQYAELMETGRVRLCYAGTSHGALYDIRVVMTVIDQPGSTRIERRP